MKKKITNYLNEDKNFKIEYSAEPKIDGISASLIYKNKKLVAGLSRGDGQVGEDITANLRTIMDIPKIISSKDFPDEIDIRGEASKALWNYHIASESYGVVECVHQIFLHGVI